MKLAFFVSSYRSPEQLGRLLQTLRRTRPDAEIVVHHDVFQSPAPAEVVAAAGGHLLTSPHPIVWGDMTLEAARWRVMRWALQSLEFDWLVLLSEQDYPIAAADVLDRRLAPGLDVVMDAERIDAIADPAERAECRRRYGYQYVTMRPWRPADRLPEPVRSWVRRGRDLAHHAVVRSQGEVALYSTGDALALPARIGVRARHTPFDDAWPCWWGSAWYALSRTAVTRLLAFIDARPDVLRYYERTVIPLESATATIVCNDPELGVELGSLHAINWTHVTSGRPDLLREEDLEALLATGMPFARKFDLEAQPALLDAIDARVLGLATSAA